jgi:hypothetical protein
MAGARVAIVLSAVAVVLSWTTSVAPAAATSLFTLASSCGRFDPNAFPFGMSKDLDANGDFHVDHGGFLVPGVPQKVASARGDFAPNRPRLGSPVLLPHP